MSTKNEENHSIKQGLYHQTGPQFEGEQVEVLDCPANEEVVGAAVPAQQQERCPGTRELKHSGRCVRAIYNFFGGLINCPFPP